MKKNLIKNFLNTGASTSMYQRLQTMNQETKRRAEKTTTYKTYADMSKRNKIIEEAVEAEDKGLLAPPDIQKLRRKSKTFRFSNLISSQFMNSPNSRRSKNI